MIKPKTIYNELNISLSRKVKVEILQIKYHKLNVWTILKMNNTFFFLSNVSSLPGHWPNE